MLRPLGARDAGSNDGAAADGWSVRDLSSKMLMAWARCLRPTTFRTRSQANCSSVSCRHSNQAPSVKSKHAQRPRWVSKCRAKHVARFHRAELHVVEGRPTISAMAINPLPSRGALMECSAPSRGAQSARRDEPGHSNRDGGSGLANPRHWGPWVFSQSVV